jgi:hypothetical protein
MHPSIKPTCNRKAEWKLGLLILLVLLPLSLGSCASTQQLAQKLEENHGNVLTPLSTEPAIKPADKLVGMTADELADHPPPPLKVCAAVPAKDLQDMRGCQGVYFFDFAFDINLLNYPNFDPNKDITSSGQVFKPNGSPDVSQIKTSVGYSDSNVSYMAGFTETGLSSQLQVKGQDNIVIANTQFNIHLPSASVLIPTINVMPGAGLIGLGTK